jgi:cold shock protein
MRPAVLRTSERSLIDLVCGDIPLLLRILMDVEWDATKITGSQSAAVTTTITPPQDRAPERRPINPRPSAPQGSEPVEAIVKWFNAEKGFGFVAVVGGPEAFMHIRQLEAAGHSSVSEAARVMVRIGQGPKGPEVTEVIEVALSTAQSGSSAERRPATLQVMGQVRESTGTVKLYKADKGFGFVAQDGGGKDVFVHATALARAGLNGLAEGQRVRMQISQGQKGLEAQAIEPLD